MFQSVGMYGVLAQSASAPHRRHQIVLYAAVQFHLGPGCIKFRLEAHAARARGHAGLSRAVLGQLSDRGFRRDDEPRDRCGVLQG